MIDHAFTRIREMSLAGLVAGCAIIATAVVNVTWSIHYWSEGEHAFVYQAFGLCMIAIELTGLVVIAEAYERGERRKAMAWGAVFAAALLLNSITDFSAVISRSAETVEARGRDQAAYDAALQTERDLLPRIAGYQDQLVRRGGERPLAAVQGEVAELAGVERAMQQRGLALPRRQQVRLSGLRSELATLAALGEARVALAEARDVIVRFGRRPSLPAQYEGAARILAAFGIQQTPEGVQAWVSVLIALIIKAIIVVGPWVLLPSQGPEISFARRAYAPGEAPLTPRLEALPASVALEEAFREFEDD